GATAAASPLDYDHHSGYRDRLREHFLLKVGMEFLILPPVTESFQRFTRNWRDCRSRDAFFFRAFAKNNLQKTIANLLFEKTIWNWHFLICFREKQSAIANCRFAFRKNHLEMAIANLLFEKTIWNWHFQICFRKKQSAMANCKFAF